VMDATHTESAVLVSLSQGSQRALLLAADNPERVESAVFICPAVALGEGLPWRGTYSWADELDTDDGWAKYNRHYWRRDYADFAQFFFSEMTSEPHSTKAIEDAVGWALDGSVEAMLGDAEAEFPFDLAAVEAICRAVSCPMLLVHGSEDMCQSPARARRLAELTGAPLVIIEGADHMIPGRHRSRPRC